MGSIVRASSLAWRCDHLASRMMYRALDSSSKSRSYEPRQYLRLKGKEYQTAFECLGTYTNIGTSPQAAVKTSLFAACRSGRVSIIWEDAQAALRFLELCGRTRESLGLCLKPWVEAASKTVAVMRDVENRTAQSAAVATPCSASAL